MVFRKADIENIHPSKSSLPIDKIMELHKKGYSCRGIVRELSKMGVVTSKDSVNRRINDYSIMR